ncbi:sigma-54-dependent transcriptional regulator [Metabacillus litoralis]|jgi:DNA-binding NtrC family response regulator|uniref:sigma-54-dependent transcriptional regulator n=1 Tax=Metabacillus litoralis TaxID=152268 RepID=UPI00203FC73F|nr:sigma-54 dependent transcriptional regulator [Metabacillus litoralis]MCM3653251.1 sigma-54 dependent transcriptional regulator [Metabacillus litoralis]
MNPVVLIVDDEPAIGSSLRFALETDYDVTATTHVPEAYELLSKQRIDVILLDWRLGEYNGLEVLTKMKEIQPQTSIIMMTAYGTIESSVEAMKRGAYHYITKPLDIDELHILIQKTLEHQELHNKIRQLNETIEKIKGYDQMIGKSQVMRQVFSIIDKVKDIDSSVLVFGESGTGKELVARGIHRQGKRAKGPFISVNCAAIPEALLESELFGFAKGAFTGAVRNQIGKIAAADRGTLFLDEIGEMPPSLQAKMLRVLQEKEITPLGSTEEKKVDVRIISATNKELLRMVEEGSFREDLYFRLNVIPIELPSLRERKEDLALLIPYFLNKYAEEMQKPLPSLSQEAYKKLHTYDYPGNIRQLGNILEYAVAMAKGSVISEQDLPIVIQNEQEDSSLISAEFVREKRVIEIPINSTMKEAERLIIESVLLQCEGNRRKTANMLGISERNLRNKLNLYRQD